MHTETKELLRTAIVQCMPMLAELSRLYRMPTLVWKRTSTSNWHGEFVDGPDLLRAYSVADAETSRIAKAFYSSFALNHPEYCQPVGGFFGVLTLTPSHMFRHLLGHVFRVNGRFEVNNDEIDEAIESFERFVDTPTIELKRRATLLNFSASVDSIDLHPELRIRRLSEAEVNERDGGDTNQLTFRRRRQVFDEFCVEGRLKVAKVFGWTKDSSFPEMPSRHDFDMAILGLRTFKEGRVGFDQIDYHPVGYCPLPIGSYTFGDLHVPLGSYRVDASEVASLTAHVRKVTAISDDAMRMACSRLADSVLRVRSEDKLVDAVIGMEALLLAGLNKEDRKGELKFRFSLHYSTLHQSANERYEAFRVAKDLYDLRSTVAHGSNLKQSQYRIGQKRHNLNDAAEIAVEVLRFIVKRFLECDSPPPYKDHSFWERGYFGLSTLDLTTG
jgi:hypothetical protein